MINKNPYLISPSEQRQAALSKWDDAGGAIPRAPEKTLIPEEIQPAIPLLTNTELVRRRVRVIALQNVVLAEASDRTLERIREMASYISPSSGSAHHHLTIHAASQMVNLANRPRHFRDSNAT